MGSVTGKSNDAVTNSLEYLNLDPTIGMLFPTAVRSNTLHGAWVRTGGNALDWTMIGYAIDAGYNVVWVGKLTGLRLVTIGPGPKDRGHS